MTAAAAAFEQLGQVREHLTRLQDLAADIEDYTLSRHIRTAMRANTLALERTNALLKTTEPAEPDLGQSTARRAQRS